MNKNNLEKYNYLKDYSIETHLQTVKLSLFNELIIDSVSDCKVDVRLPSSYDMHSSIILQKNDVICKLPETFILEILRCLQIAQR